MTRSDTMESISLSDVALVDTKTVSSDGRVYLGQEMAGQTVKIVAVDQGEE